MTPDAARLAAAREAYVRRHPISLARHVLAIAAGRTPTRGALPFPLPFPLAFVGRDAGCLLTADGERLIDCRGPLPGMPGGPASRLLFHLELLAAGLLVGEDGGVADPPDPAAAARLRAAITVFLGQDADRPGR